MNPNTLAFNRAFVLAIAFGHWWAKCFVNEIPKDGVTTNARDEKAAKAARKLLSSGGWKAVNDAAEVIERSWAAEINGEPWIGIGGGWQHTTQSETLSWDISTDGSVVFTAATGWCDSVAPDGVTTIAPCRPVDKYSKPFNAGDEDIKVYVWNMLHYAVITVGGMLPPAPPPARPLPRGRAAIARI
jgi:hypothetical protein